MNQEMIKKAVSEFFSSKGYEVLDMFYKKPCDSCLIIDKWDKFNLLPDFLLKIGSKLFFSFLLTDDSKIPLFKDYIKRFSKILPSKLFLMHGNQLYEIENIEDVSKRSLIAQDLFIKEDYAVGPSSRTFKSMSGRWEEQRRIGSKGEEEVAKLLKASGAEIMDLNFNAPCDSCSNIQNWHSYNKLPDGIAKIKSNIFFYEAKSKKSRNLIVNERDYIEYQNKLKFLPVNIYFIVFSYDLKKIKEIYLHKVNMNEHGREHQWNGNYTVDLSNEVEQLA